MKPMNVENARSVFLEIYDILSGFNVRFFLNNGTLLGAIRDGDIIAWDNDLDLKIIATDWKPEIQKEFERNEFHYKHSSCPRLFRDKSSGCVIFKKRIRTDVGLIYYYPPDDLCFTLPHRPNNTNTLRAASFYRGDYFVDFLGVRVRVPYPPEEYVQIIYGKDWRIPKRCDFYNPEKKPISLEKYVKYILDHPEANQ